MKICWNYYFMVVKKFKNENYFMIKNQYINYFNFKKIKNYYL